MPKTSSSPGDLVALSQSLVDAVSSAGRALVSIHARPRIPSTGIVWRTGTIVTADHTIRNEEGVRVTLDDGRTIDAAIGGRDPATDLAVLTVNAANATQHPTAALGDSDAMRTGHLVLALGRASRDVSAALGIVSSTVAAQSRARGSGALDRLFRLDVSIYDGFSGGALVNAGGEIVGLTTSGFGRGAAMAIPARAVTRIAEQLLEGGRVRRGHLGVAMQPVRLAPAQARALGEGIENDTGLIVIGVEPDGTAAQAGVLVGDIVVLVGNSPVRDVDDVLAAMANTGVGQPLTLGLVRGGAPVDVTVQLGERPGGRR
ncbi:MAG TPA: trypsin-like peptidase domain-containing protein [Steroidobacter sp.]|jgi:S1-C subfamily serine protease